MTNRAVETRWFPPEPCRDKDGLFASDKQIRWMNVTDYLKRHGKGTKQILFDGEPFTALNLVRMKDKLFR